MSSAAARYSAARRAARCANLARQGPTGVWSSARRLYQNWVLSWWTFFAESADASASRGPCQMIRSPIVTQLGGSRALSALRVCCHRAYGAKSLSWRFWRFGNTSSLAAKKVLSALEALKKSSFCRSGCVALFETAKSPDPRGALRPTPEVSDCTPYGFFSCWIPLLEARTPNKAGVSPFDASLTDGMTRVSIRVPFQSFMKEHWKAASPRQSAWKRG
eukprot:scaffold2893_cov254-Pinguiococcus_pyrenoidosus.AAC.31